MPYSSGFKHALQPMRILLLAAHLLATVSALSPAQAPVAIPIDILNAGKWSYKANNLVLGDVGIIPYGTIVQGPVYVPNTGSCVPFDLTVVPNPIVNPIYVLNENVGDCESFVKVLNAVEAGAAAVIIISQLGQADIISPGELLNPYSPSYWQDRVRIPVGKVSSAQGNNLLPLQNVADAQIHLDFTQAIVKAPAVEVELWFDADDSCGKPCDTSQEFITDMAVVAQKRGQTDALTFSPHWLIDYKCRTPDDPEECKKHCVGNNYCFYSYADDQFSVDPVGDLAVIQETIRRICLWDVLKKAGRTAIFWDYVTRFADNCQSSKGKFNEKCSQWSVEGIDKTDWENCYKQMDTTNPIAPVEAEIQASKGTSTIPYIDRNLRGTVRINQVQYRGAPHANMVMQTACMSLAASNRDVCNVIVPGICPYSDPATQACLTPDNRAAYKTKCFRDDAGHAQCGCEVGYTPNKDGVCVDVNECELPSICPYPDTRNVCRNNAGGYDCTNYADICLLDARGSCWQSADKTVNACEDNIGEFRKAAEDGLPMPPASDIAICTCDAVKGGCYKTVVVNGNEECKKVRCMNVGAIVGGLIAALFIITLSIVAIVWYIRRRRALGGKAPNVIGASLPANFRGSSAWQGRFAKFDDTNVEMAPKRGAPNNAGNGMAAHPIDLKIALEKVDLAGQ